MEVCMGVWESLKQGSRQHNLCQEVIGSFYRVDRLIINLIIMDCRALKLENKVRSLIIQLLSNYLNLSQMPLIGANLLLLIFLAALTKTLSHSKYLLSKCIVSKT